MNRKQLLIFATLLLISVVVLESHVGFCAGEIPKGWGTYGNQVQNYEMGIDLAVKHTGKAGAYIKFVGDSAVGFGTLMQAFNAEAYRGKRVRMSAWMKTENAASAQLWMRLDGNKRMLGFDNMDNRPVTGTTEWKKYEITLEVPEATINIAFGAFVIKQGQTWVDDFQFEVAGPEAATTNMLTPEQMNKEHNLDAPANLPKQPANLDFEEGAWPERKAANVDPKIFEAYVGQYQGPSGQAWMVSVETNRLWLDDMHSGKFELLPQSETEFFVKDWPMATFIFVKNEKGVVTHYLSRFNGEDTVIKKIK